MIRFLTYLFAGIVLGGIIHISVILIMPNLSTHNAWTSIERVASPNQIKVIKREAHALRAALDLDPAFVYAVCRVDLADGPVALSGSMPANFWTAALIGPEGEVPYSTNSRTNNNRDLKIGIFTVQQAEMLISEEIDIDPDLQIIRVPSEKLAAIVRVLPSHSDLASAMEEQLGSLKCAQL